MGKKAITIILLTVLTSCAAAPPAQRPGMAGAGGVKGGEKTLSIPPRGKLPEEKEAPKNSPLEKRYALFIENAKKRAELQAPAGKEISWEEFAGTPYEEDAHLVACALDEVTSLKSAEQCFRDHVKKYGKNEAVLEKLLSLSLARGDVKTSKKIVNSLENLGSLQMARTFSMMACYYISTGEGEKAEALLAEARNLGLPDDIYLMEKAQILLSRRDSVEAKKLLARVSGRGKKTESFTLISSIAEGDPENLTGREVPPLLTPASVHVKALLIAEKGALDEAVKILETWLKKNPEDGKAHILLGNVYFRKKLFLRAKEEYEAALREDPENAEAYLNLGLVSDVYLDEPDVAKNAYRKYIELGGERKEEVKKWLRAIEIRLGMEK